MYPLHPNTCAVRVFTLGEAQVIGQAVVFIDTEKGVVARHRRDGRRSNGGRATSDDKRAGITSFKKYQALRDRRPEAVGGGDLTSIRTNPPQGGGIDYSGRENPRFRYAYGLASYWNELRIVHVRLRRVPLPIANGVVNEDRVFGGHD